MSYYDTRHKDHNLPSHGWLFPCIDCEMITSGQIVIVYKSIFKKQTYTCNKFLKKKVTVPVCTKCKIKNIKYILDPSLIKNN